MSPPVGFKYSCKVPGCKNLYYYGITDQNRKNKHFFAFPKQTEQRRKWFESINKFIPAGYLAYTDKQIKVCEDHFRESSFTSTLRTRLLPNAVPKCYAPTDVPTAEECSSQLFQLHNQESTSKGLKPQLCKTNVQTSPRTLFTRPFTSLSRPDIQSESKRSQCNQETKICRFCMKECATMKSIYVNDNIHQRTIIDLVKNCFMWEIEEHEALPSSICHQCEAEIYQICEFKLKFDKSTKYFRKYIAHLKNENIGKAQVKDAIKDVKTKVKGGPMFIEYPILSDIGIAIDDAVLEFVEESSDAETQPEEKIIKKTKKTINKNEEVNVYKCNKCNAIFESKIKLTDHRRKLLHYTRKTVTCSQCKLLVPVQNYKSHFLKHSLEFKCEICGKKFSNNFNLKRHLCIHTNQMPYACDICGNKFARQDKLKAHVMIHTCEKPFTCDTCGQQFRLRDKLKQHQEKSVCSNEVGGYSEKYKRTLTCEVCSKSFTLLSSLRVHQLLHTDEHVICSICGKPYPNEKKLKEHKLQVHSGKAAQGKQFLCNFCAKQYSSKTMLQRHILSHLGLAKSYSCKICNKLFTQSGSLALHLKIHTGEKPFVCHVCSRAFNKPSNLQRHIRSHENIRPYVCAICEKSFSVKHSLVVHTRIHTGEKPFDCPVCGKKFVDRGSMTKHLKIHNGQD